MLRRLLGLGGQSKETKIPASKGLWKKLDQFKTGEERVRFLLDEHGYHGCSVYMTTATDLRVSLPAALAGDLQVVGMVTALRMALGTHAPVVNERTDPSLKKPRVMLAGILAKVAKQEGRTPIRVTIGQK